MPKPWAEVASSQEYQSLPPAQQEAARQQYFQQVVAPQLNSGAEIAAARAQFDQQTTGKSIAAWRPCASP